MLAHQYSAAYVAVVDQDMKETTPTLLRSSIHARIV